MKKSVLFIGGGIETVPGVKRARELGYETVVSDVSPAAPAFEYADYTLIASTYDKVGTLSAAINHHCNVSPIHGVLCMAVDVPITVATVAKELNLLGIPIKTAILAMDKLAMKENLSSNGIPVPFFKEVCSPIDLDRIIREYGYPLIIKPVDSRGARGVLKLTEDVDTEWAFYQSRKHSPSDRVMVEQFLNGPQISTESLVIDGIAYTPGFSDRNYEYMDRFAPHVIENGGELPSFLDEKTQQEIRTMIQEAVKSMGINNAVAKGDVVVFEGKPFIIEIAARLSGGYFCSHEIPLNTGVDFVGAAIRLCVGDPINKESLMPKFQRGVAQRYLFPDPGKVVSIRGVEDVKKSPDIALCEIRVKTGDTIGPVDSHPARAGVVIATGVNREEAVLNVTEAVKRIKIMTG